MKHIERSVEKRNLLLFAPSADSFRKQAGLLLDEVKHNLDRDHLVVAADVAVDLQSALKSWRLQKYIDAGYLTQKEIDEVSEELLKSVFQAGARDLYDSAQSEIESIRGSSVWEMCRLTEKKELNTFWGHDYASGLTYSIRRGARWMTNNPCKVTLFRKDCPELFEKLAQDAKNEFPDAGADELTSLIFMKVCALNAYALYPIFEVTDGEWGFICIQVDPFQIPEADGAKKMVDQVLFWDKAFKRELNVEKPNVVYKLPAVENGIQAARELVEKGYRVCMTLNFSVSQHETFARILSHGRQKGFVVLMGGLLDDKVAAELNSLGIENAKEAGRHAAQAVIRKSYRNLQEKGLGDIAIMTAAVRGPWAIANTLAPGNGPKTLITTLKAKIEEFDQNPAALVSTMAEPVSPDILETLKKSRVFNQAYSLPEEGQLTWDDLYDFPPFLAFYDQFRDAYKEIWEYAAELAGDK